jgi:predicted nucleic acid-binding protein
MILDTDVLIWYFRGNTKAKTIIEKSRPFCVSAITVMELMQGAKNKTEQRAMYKQLCAWDTRVIHLNEAISVRAVQLVSDFALSHSMAVADALIAGTVIENADELLTANTKHFEHIPRLNLRKFNPGQ